MLQRGAATSAPAGSTQRQGPRAAPAGGAGSRHCPTRRGAARDDRRGELPIHSSLPLPMRQPGVWHNTGSPPGGFQPARADGPSSPRRLKQGRARTPRNTSAADIGAIEHVGARRYHPGGEATRPLSSEHRAKSQDRSSRHPRWHTFRWKSSTAYISLRKPGQGSDSSGSVVLEAGDWIVPARRGAPSGACVDHWWRGGRGAICGAPWTGPSRGAGRAGRQPPCGNHGRRRSGSGPFAKGQGPCHAAAFGPGLRRSKAGRRAGEAKRPHRTASPVARPRLGLPVSAVSRTGLPGQAPMSPRRMTRVRRSRLPSRRDASWLGRRLFAQVADNKLQLLHRC